MKRMCPVPNEIDVCTSVFIRSQRLSYQSTNLQSEEFKALVGLQFAIAIDVKKKKSHINN